MITGEKMLPWLTGFLLGVFILTIGGSIFFFYLFQDRIYPGIKIDNIEVGGLTRDQTKQLLQLRLQLPLEYSITLEADEVKLASSSSQLKISREYNQAITQAYEVGRVGFPPKKLWILAKSALTPLEFQTNLTYNQAGVRFFVQELKKEVDLIGHHPQAVLNYSGSPASLVIDEGKLGKELLVEETSQLVFVNIGTEQSIAAKVATTHSILGEEEVVVAEKRAANLVNKRLILRAENVRLDLNDQQLVSLLTFPAGFNQEEISSLLESWQDIVSRPAQNAEFEFNEATLQVSKFVPHREGLELDRAQTTALLETTLNNFIAQKSEAKPVGIHNQTNTELDLPVNTTQPDIALASTNELGIKERIGFGESEYDHSIKNRVHNVKITTDKISNTIVAPGEEFSFNKTLGEVSAATGYRSAYVIKDGRTELGDGGGVCQVSTTVFRAVLDAGLDIIRRLPHSYRVSYYELNAKPGIDATVYSGETDFRFVNDTDHHILIHGEDDSDNLYMKIEIYGTSDGRTAEIKDHEVWGYVNPPPAEYYPDPTLPTGVRRQIDWSVAGVKAKFTHVIKNAAGEITNETTYNSNYRPWSAKYLIGE